MKLYVATHNQHKIREISQILPGFEVIPDDPDGVEETAPDFIGNAFIKVRAIAARHPGEWCMADDSGLEVAALGGEPGVRSARYAGEPSSTPANNALLLKNLADIPDRTANFTCAIALVDPEGVEHEAVGKCFGHIATEPSGAEGFGYDPLFIPDGYDKSFADLTADEKNAISHRGRALAKVREMLTGGKRGPRWLRFFRAVNLPTVPGDVLVGAAAVCAFSLQPAVGVFRAVAWASSASVFLYMFGLADNDIEGARNGERSRPIGEGLISPAAARIARALCLFAAMAVAAAAGLPSLWWAVVSVLLITVVAYNRTKAWLLMGACRALNVLAGAAAVGLAEWDTAPLAASLCAAFVWLVYVAVLTKFSTGEEFDPRKKKTVGVLIGALVYLQLAALIAFTLVDPRVTPLLVAGAVLLVVLRMFKRFMPLVSAS